MADCRLILAAICLLTTTVVLSSGSKESRHVMTEYLAPADAFVNGSFVNLVHSTAVGPRDALHYVYSTRGRPSVLMARTGLGAKLAVNWTRFVSPNSSEQEGSVKFDQEVLASALLSFDAMYTFNDTKDTARMDQGSNVTRIETASLVWEMSIPSDIDPNLVRFTSFEKNSISNQTIIIQFLASSGLEESTSELPHLLLSNNLTQINVYLRDIINSFASPRLGLELTLFSDKGHFRQSVVVEEKSLNDELSPGAFRTNNWLSNENASSESSSTTPGAFVQWKPICYLDASERNIHTLTSVVLYDLRHLNYSDDRVALDGLATGFYGHSLEWNTWMSSLNVSFGTTGDGSYSKTKFVTWQLTFGIGLHPQGSVSLLVILLIAIGLGIPLVVMIVGAVYVPLRERLVRRRGYEELSSSYPRIG